MNVGDLLRGSQNGVIEIQKRTMMIGCLLLLAAIPIGVLAFTASDTGTECCDKICTAGACDGCGPNDACDRSDCTCAHCASGSACANAGQPACCGTASCCDR